MKLDILFHYDVDETTGKYTFDGIPMQGADGEDFLVTVELDPTAYTEGSAEDKIVVNDVNLPVFSGLYGSTASAKRLAAVIMARKTISQER